MSSFAYDVFLSYSSKDKAAVHQLAQQLKEDGLRVWLDAWEILPGDNIPGKIEDALERSAVLVLCMSAHAFGSDWTRLESQTFRFRDPSNKNRRFVPLRLDNAEPMESLIQFAYIDWRYKGAHGEYERLLEICKAPNTNLSAATVEEFVTSYEAEEADQKRFKSVRSVALSTDSKQAISGSYDFIVRLWDMESARVLRAFEGHKDLVFSVALSTDAKLAISGSADMTARLWNVENGDSQHIFTKHTDRVLSVALSGDGKYALSGSDDKTVRLWATESGRTLKVFKGHLGGVWSVNFSRDERRVLSSSVDRTVRVWDVESGRALHVLKGHTDVVLSAALSRDGKRAVSGSADKTVRVWDVESGRALHVLEGHTNRIFGVALSNDGKHALSGSDDETVRLWDVEVGQALRIFEGHSGEVWSVAFTEDGRRALSGSSDNTLRLWDIESGEALRIFEGSSGRTLPPMARDEHQYTNAKILLVGDTGVGKTGLARYLALGMKDEERNSSTDGAWATQWSLPSEQVENGIQREIWLWDFAGQVDYRLVHQLFMDDTAAAVLVFNPQNENPFEGLGQWDRDLHKATRKPFAKLLAAGRIDRGGLVVSRGSLDKFMQERGFVGPLYETSAKTGEGCDRLREGIIAAIAWQNIATTTSPVLYRRMKQEILELRDNGPVLIRLAELKQRVQMKLLTENFEVKELETVVGLLAGPGMIQKVSFGEFILLRPEVLSRYAAAVVRQVRKHPQELGCIGEEDMLAGKLDYQDFERLPREQEEIVLRTLHETLISRAWCLRQITDGKILLTFPSYFRRERPTQPNHPSILVTYRFSGPADDIYATLVVRLHYSPVFESHQLWRFAADFKTQTGQGLGLKLTPETEGAYRLDVYFDADVDDNSRVLFARYVHIHLYEHAQSVMRLRHYACGNKKCKAYGAPLADRSAIDAALASNERQIFCLRCGKPILLRDVLEKKLESAQIEQQTHEIQTTVQEVLDNESRELILVGHAYSIVAEAGQIYRGYGNSDHGIDGEIEFKDDKGNATGRRLYLQLKSGDSYLTKRQRDDAEIFHIKKPRWAEYWRAQAYPVMLVIRGSRGEIRWMDVSAYLKSVGGTVKQVVFDGERFDVMSVRRWRDRMLKSTV